jgi:hypothetical protein
VFIFNEGQKKLTEAELEKLVEADMTEWARIKSSKKADDWVSYLRTFPNGRFAEIAQMRLTRLLADAEKERQEKQRQEEERLAAEKRRQEEQRLAEEQKRLEKERAERERIRLAEEQRLAAEAKRVEEQQRQEMQRRLEEQKSQEARRRLEQEYRERERARTAEAERRAAERKREEEQRLLAEQKRVEQEKLALAKSEQIAAAKPAVAQATPAAASVPSSAAKPAPPTVPSRMPGTFMINIGAGLPVPQLIAPSDNPFSAGRYPLGRIFTIGDEATIRQSDILTGVEETTYTARVTRVDYDEDRVEFNNGHTITDLMGNAIKSGPVEFDTPVQWTPAEFQVGKKWTAAFLRTQKGVISNVSFDMQIVKRETITVPAGTFDTFRIEGQGWNMTAGIRGEMKIWLVPGLNFTIKSEQIRRNKMGRFSQTERRELVSLRQHTIDTKCALPTGGLKRTLTIESNCTG